MNKLIIRENKKLLDAAKNLFGAELVVDAWLAVDAEDFYTAEDYKGQLDSQQERLNVDDTKIDLDVISFVIKFVNGNCLEFTSSEWGSITKVPEDLLITE